MPLPSVHVAYLNESDYAKEGGRVHMIEKLRSNETVLIGKKKNTA